MAKNHVYNTQKAAPDTARRTKNVRGFRRLALGSFGLGALLAGVLPVWAARRILYPQPPEMSEPDPSADLQIEVGVTPERVRFEARDGGYLGGWFVPGPQGVASPWPCVLLVYGYGGHKEQMVGYAKIIHDAGFATFMFDMRGSGLRRSEPISLGYRERWDVIDAVRYLEARPDVEGERLGALGVSLGAAIVLLAAAEEPSIKAVVADSPFASLTDMVKPGLRAFVGPHAVLLSRPIVKWAEVMIGVKTDEIHPERAAAALGDRPLLVIHGEDDTLIEVEASRRVYAAASGPKELWLVPGCTHAQAPTVAADEYASRVTGFYKQWLGTAAQ